MEITFEEAIEYLQDGEMVTLESDGYTYEVGPSEHFIGGDVAEGFISVVLGNVIYPSATGILQASIDFLSRDGQTVTVTI